MESNLQQNFNVGFTNMKSDVLVHLTQWQYWWWFWFSLLWAFYYLMILKMVRFRSLKFRPRLATTFRPHGKWGDLIVCIIPVSWCANIITNSNFILRMIEWQSESGLLTVRIRGKQWYWVYKFELKTFTDVFTVPKNVGHNKWQISTPNDLQVADDYLHILQLRSQNRWVKSYWEDLSKEMSKSKNFHMISPKDFILNKLNDNVDENYHDSILASFTSFNHYLVEDSIRVFDRSDLCEKLNFFLKESGFIREFDRSESLEENFLDSELNVDNDVEKLSFLIDDELRESFIQILKDHPVSRQSFVYLAQQVRYNNFIQKDFEEFFNKLNLPTDILKDNQKVIAGNEPLEIDFSNERDLKNYLVVISAFNVDSSHSNFELLHKMHGFFVKNFSSQLKNFSEDSEVFKRYSDYFEIFNLSQEDFKEYLKMIRDMKLPELVDTYFDVTSSDVDYDIESLVDDRIWLDSSENSDLLVRLSNKKSNWDESGLNDSLNESFRYFLSNSDIFESRYDEMDHINNSFINKKYSLYTKYFSHSNDTYTYSDFNEFDRNSRKSQGTVSPVRLIKYPISNKTNFDFSSDVIELFRFRFSENESSTEHRLTPNSAFLIIRQKRYKRRKVILPRTIFYKDEEGNLTKRVKSSNYTFLSQNSIILENDFNATKRYKFFKKNKMRDELTNLVLSKRILRTRRTLVLPAHLNITAITNSFDVVHSWFIPGLGLKMDAVPGRATHHTFYIDNVGFYYGQCAEICGRYHHHMPIRICALPFEHFLLWWQSFGLPKLLFTRNFRRYGYSYGSRKYAW